MTGLVAAYYIESQHEHETPKCLKCDIPTRYEILDLVQKHKLEKQIAKEYCLSDFITTKHPCISWGVDSHR